MKRNQLIKHLKNNNCILYEHGSKHDIYINKKSLKKTTIPRHIEIDNNLVKNIYKQLGIKK